MFLDFLTPTYNIFIRQNGFEILNHLGTTGCGGNYKNDCIYSKKFV